jgi:hypothetical protein
MNKTRFIMLASMILAAVASRLIPHPPSFTPIAAIALFGGAQFSSKRAAFLVPMVGMFLSDLVLGFSALTPAVYGSFALMVCLGFLLRHQRNALQVTGATIVGAVLFFILTNLGVWAIENWYPKTTSGLADCYIAAIPFLRNMVLGNLLYSALLFGGMALAEIRFVQLREPAMGAA